MAFPTDIDTYRTFANIAGIVYDADDTKTIFEEDLNAWSDTLTALQELIGTTADRKTADLYLSIAQLLYPVGIIVEFDDDTDPATAFGFGTWELYGAGRVAVCRDSADTDFDTDGETGGEKTHTLTEDEMPGHTHVQDAHNHTQDAHNHTQNAHGHVIEGGGNTIGRLDNNPQAMGGTSNVGNVANVVNDATATNQAATATNQAATATNQATGGDDPHNNLQPYVVVRRYRRTA